ncbi:MAG: diacylglycerol kinase [Desulfofustis sp.]|nr:diacylglycerol kinase [Desulfofustis sp.]NNK14611.1 diacylglycerol kinase [Desulfofustis sp.]NNK56873.1 diacylglycerol kinase [Desulfofustis sp.]
MDKPKSKKGMARLVAALRYSLQGIVACYRNEEAFRQEVIVFGVLLVVIILMPVSGMIKLMLFSINSLVLIVELLNSAVEAIVDRVSPEYDELAGRAKDMGSAAVLLSLIAAAAVWAYALYQVI